MAWWVWLLVCWVAVGVPAMVLLGRRISTAEERDWIRRGRPDRRDPSSQAVLAEGERRRPG